MKRLFLALEVPDFEKCAITLFKSKKDAGNFTKFSAEFNFNKLN